MKRVEERQPQTAMIIFRILLIIAAILFFILISGTIYSLIKRGKSSADGESLESLTSSAGTSIEGESIFSSIGIMRIPTADPEPETLVISIAFPYNKNDRPFSEELASRLSWFKTATAEYLSVFTAEELSGLDADTVNKELLTRFNSALRLGQIRELYILDFMRL